MPEGFRDFLHGGKPVDSYIVEQMIVELRQPAALPGTLIPHFHRLQSREKEATKPERHHGNRGRPAGHLGGIRSAHLKSPNPKTMMLDNGSSS
jgi:hypothetical protein